MAVEPNTGLSKVTSKIKETTEHKPNNKPTTPQSIAQLKNVVATEVAFMLRQNNVDPASKLRVLDNMIRAFDLPDEWWDAHDRHRKALKTSVGPTTIQWAKIFFDDPYAEWRN
jgi:hypothetical protein